MKTKTLRWKIFFHILLILGSIIMVVPFYWMISTSLKTNENVLRLPPQIIPNPVSFEAYKNVWVNLNFLRYTFNSFFLTVMNIIGTILSCSIVAFGFAMFEFRTKKLFFMLMLGTLMMPGQVTMIPTYFIWKELRALDSYLPLIIPSFLGQAFGIFLLHQNYKTLPKALYESALIDGCNPFKILFRIYMPLSVPAITTLVVFTFIGAWNNTLGPLLYIKTRDLYTLPLGLLALNSSYEANANMAMKMAAATITMTPVIIVYLFAQRYFVEGMANAGIKG